MIKKIILITFLIFVNFSTYFLNASIYIYASVDGEIITNHDIAKESEYLTILNPNLIQLNKQQISELAKTSLINEIIKKKELFKIIDINQENAFIEEYLKNLYSKLNYNSEDDFKNKLINTSSYTLKQVKEKIKIELFWNELIFSKYNNQLKIDKEELRNKINNLESEKGKEYFLSEILFNKEKNKTLESSIEQIKLSIKEIGFSNTANIYSISDSSKLGGKLGWLNENSLSELISEKINKLNEGEFSDVVKVGNNYLIVKIDKIRINKIEIDKEKELEKLIRAESNKQLNKFSRIYFDKSKINYLINEK
ncbi:peptidylprolyl isomerase [Candidatus Pelagibacter sp.]|nr:peptidylprolyl isomerase [Candidatus Pelagibacter sp.]